MVEDSTRSPPCTHNLQQGDVKPDSTTELDHRHLSATGARTESGTLTGHGYTVTWDTDEQALTGTVDLAAAAHAPKPPALLTSAALVDFLV